MTDRATQVSDAPMVMEVPIPGNLIDLKAHLEADLPMGHGKEKQDDGTDADSFAKVTSLHNDMHGGQAQPAPHVHPAPVYPAGKAPRNLVRAGRGGYELRASEDGGMPTMFGHFARFNEWTEINSRTEGHFMEQIAPGAFARSMEKNRAGIRSLFQHGADPQIGDKVLGPIAELREDGDGAYYEVPLLDTSYNRDLIPGLEAGLYGASFRFAVDMEQREKAPSRSDYNPEGIPERTITEATLYEFGPVTFPAYAGATAGVRSLTDEFVFGRYAPMVATVAEQVRAVLAEEVTEGGKTGTTPRPETPARKRRYPKSRNYLKVKGGEPWRL